MDEIEIPSHFICPISMQLMRDPVIVATGMTYDRESIEKWLYSCKNNICPMTKLELPTKDLTPNHTLRRLIQAWCMVNSSNGIERIPTPKPQVDKSQILKLINEAKRSAKVDDQIRCLKKLRSISQGSQSNKKCLEAAGAADFLVELLIKKSSDEFDAIKEEAFNVLYHLDVSDSDLKKLVSDDKDSENFLASLMQVLRWGDCQSRLNAIMLMKSAFNVADPVQMMSCKVEVFVEIVRVLKDQVSPQASKAALKLLMELCPWGRNRIKVVEAGAISTLIEILIDNSEKRACELILTVLDQLCRIADGRAELLAHGAGLAIISKKILRVSQVASDRAVRIISSVCKYSGTSRVLQEMLQVGVVAKLCLVLQVENNSKILERVREILKLHSRSWKDSPCIPPSLISSYPLA
ncbi:OLC1v1004793C1 [Oldenlandia corymbosa var. corymbosa]|uniref:U-box domain-containing protein n=1 Tax=Oldenlandia corymbosa var. corymbosa TaxID=529605 RepID=A0AAV1DFJ8_OLDCO|nr:OLC1v1004793C1 [Oldenlandia corymbosa var. corymbosa]